MGFTQYQGSDIFFIDVIGFSNLIRNGPSAIEALDFTFTLRTEIVLHPEDELVFSILVNDAQQVQQLLDAGFDYRDCCALHFASRFGRFEIVEVLLKHNKHIINLQNSDGNTALWNAFFPFGFRMLINLLRNEADPTIGSDLSRYDADVMDTLFFQSDIDKTFKSLLEDAQLRWMNWHRRKDTVLGTVVELMVALQVRGKLSSCAEAADKILRSDAIKHIINFL